MDRLSELESHLGYWLRFVSNHVSASFAQALQTRQLSVAEWVALRHLYDYRGISHGELVAFLGMTRGAVTKVLDRLESKGLVTRETTLEDARSQSLNLTPVGASLLPELAALADANDTAYFGGLSDEEQIQLRQILEKLVRIHQWKNVPVD